MVGTPHTSWDQDVSADDTSYEDANWTKIDTAFVKARDRWYAIDNENKKIILMTNTLNGTVDTEDYTFDTWSLSGRRHYSQGFSYLRKYGNNLMFNGPKAIYSMNLSTKSVSLGAKVAVIGQSAFGRNKSLTKLVLPAGIRSIGKMAFYQCAKLKNIQFKGKTVPTVAKNAFKGIYKKATFKVPAKSLKKYKAKLTAKIGVASGMKVKK